MIRQILLGAVIDLNTRHYKQAETSKKQYTFESGGIIGAPSPHDDESLVGSSWKYMLSTNDIKKALKS